MYHGPLPICKEEKRMRITVPADLLEQARKLPGTEELTDAQVVVLCLEAGMEHARKENSLEALKEILGAQDSGFSQMVLEYAQALAGRDLARQGWLHKIAMGAARLPGDKPRAVSGKKVGE